ncbi:MAG: transposase [bacterium]|nr:transposase [bacterium]
MTHESLINNDWDRIIERLGGGESVEITSRETGAFQRARGIKCGIDLLRVTLAYALGGGGFRSTAAWAAALDLAHISDVALLKRVRNTGGFLTALIGQLMSAATPASAKGRLIRIVDATSVPKFGTKDKRNNGLWRIHGVLELPSERFGAIELTDQHESEQLDRAAVVPGEIRIGDRVYLQADRIAAVLEAGGDVLVRAGWKGARWLNEDGTAFNLIATLEAADKKGQVMIDRPVSIDRKSGAPIKMRLVCLRKSPEAAAEARLKARRAAQRGKNKVSPETLTAADWVILVTSLDPDSFPAEDILALYRLRWRIELVFKRLKSLIKLTGPPAADERVAKPFILAHILMALLIEPLITELDDSPRWAA